VNFMENRQPDPVVFGGFQAFADALPCIVWIADANGKTQWFNDEFRKYSGVSLEAVMHWSWLSPVHEEDRPALAHHWAESRAKAALLDSIVRLRGADGSYRWFRIRARPFRGPSGEIEQWFGIFTDVHDRQLELEANTHVLDVLMKGFLTKTFPTVAGLKFDTLYRAANVAEKIGGDWYDIFTLPDGRIGFSIGDVSGHGIDAAVKMAEAKNAIFTAACLGDPAPERVLYQANRALFLNKPQVSITTAVYGFVDRLRRTVTYGCAGHHPPILARSIGDAVVLPNHGFPLGVEEVMPPLIRTHEISYDPGSMMVLYTDGLIEFTYDIFDGEKRLLRAATDAVSAKAEHPARFIAAHVFQAAEPLDDVAILTISFDGN
jgi:PAS domain S-box-containing protein